MYLQQFQRNKLHKHLHQLVTLEPVKGELCSQLRNKCPLEGCPSVSGSRSGVDYHIRSMDINTLRPCCFHSTIRTYDTDSLTKHKKSVTAIHYSNHIILKCSMYNDGNQGRKNILGHEKAFEKKSFFGDYQIRFEWRGFWCLIADFNVVTWLLSCVHIVKNKFSYLLTWLWHIRKITFFLWPLCFLSGCHVPSTLHIKVLINWYNNVIIHMVGLHGINI